MFKHPVFAWVSMLARIGLGIVFIAAAIPKFRSPTETTMGFQAYDLFGYDTAHFLATFVPMIETLLGVALILGCLTRIVSWCASALLCLYIALIISAWARGLTIDCGCFSTGGSVSASQTHYGVDIIRDVIFVLLGVCSALAASCHPLSLDRLFTSRSVKGHHAP